MKKHIDEVLMIVYAIFVTVILFFISSCSPEFHLNKFKKKGGKIECKGDTTTIEKIVKGKDGKDTTIYLTEYVPTIEYRTKYEIRYDYKRFKDSLQAVKQMYKDSVKTVVKTEKIQGKTEVKIQRSKSRPWLWLIIGFVLAHLLRYAWTIIGAFRNFPNLDR